MDFNQSGIPNSLYVNKNVCTQKRWKMDWNLCYLPI